MMCYQIGGCRSKVELSHLSKVEVSPFPRGSNALEGHRGMGSDERTRASARGGIVTRCGWQQDGGGRSQPVRCVISRTVHANPTRGVSHRNAPPKRSPKTLPQNAPPRRSHEPTAPKSPPIRCVKSRALRVVRCCGGGVTTVGERARRVHDLTHHFRTRPAQSAQTTLRQPQNQTLPNP
jgi:hypothetical protein